ncbi:squalene-hopene cyclase [Mycena floridula]|nr:squalene-hopene cyclase [Mycena floridula]
MNSLRQSIQRGRHYLLSLQHPDGHWQGHLLSNPTIECEDVLARRILGILTVEELEATAVSIRLQQQFPGEGGWAQYPGGSCNLSTSIESWVTLRLAGDSEDAPHILEAAAFIRKHGGISAARVFTRLWLALCGLENWNNLPILPPEIVLLPSWFPLSLPNWGSWARQTIVPLTIVMNSRPSTSLSISVACLRADATPPTSLSFFSWANVFKKTDTFLQAAENWILSHQEADGSVGGIQPPCLYSLLALRLRGYSLDHPDFVKTLAGVNTLVSYDHDRRIVAPSLSPSWDTALSIIALADSSLEKDEKDVDVFLRATQWLLEREVRKKGDWTSGVKGSVEPGGWAFGASNQNYPDTDDTSEIVMALRHTFRLISTVSPSMAAQSSDAVNRALSWLCAMQSDSGGWGAYDVNQIGSLPSKLPFCDFGEATDPPSTDVTAHIVEMFAREKILRKLTEREQEVFDKGIRYILNDQKEDGSWYGRWGCNYIYGTAAALPALLVSGIKPSSASITGAVRWLVEHQQEDGGYGEDQRSYYKPELWAGRGKVTPSQTAWALMALVAYLDVAEPHDELVELALAASKKAAEWLVSNQLSDGNWNRFQGFFHAGGFVFR